MEMIPPDSETLLEAFKNKCEIWIEGYYKIIKKKSELKKITKDKQVLKEKIQNFVYEALIKNKDDELKEIYANLFPDSFHKMIESIFNKKKKKYSPLFNFGTFHLAFKNFNDFILLEETVELIKNKLIKGECNSECITEEGWIEDRESPLEYLLSICRRVPLGVLFLPFFRLRWPLGQREPLESGVT